MFYHISAHLESIEAVAEVLLQGRLSHGIIFNVMGHRLRNELILMIFNTGEFYERLLSLFNFHLDLNILMPTSHNSTNTLLNVFHYIEIYLFVTHHIIILSVSQQYDVVA
jgi:hypothetical protein